MTTKQPSPGQPLAMLPTLGPYLDGMLETDQEQYAALLEAKPKPHILDTATVDRVIRAFTTQRENLTLFDEQIQHWSVEPTLTQAQRAEITRLQQRMVALRQVNTDVLNLAGELRKGTIESILAMDDAELGLRFLLGDLPSQER